MIKAPVRDGIEAKLRGNLTVVDLELIDESHKHAGHAGIPHNAGETHFYLKLVAKEFGTMRAVERHRCVYQILEAEIQGPVHALRMDLKGSAT